MSRNTAKITVIPETEKILEAWSSDAGEQYYLTGEVKALSARNEAGKWRRIPEISGRKSKAMIFAESKSQAEAMLERIRSAREIIMADLRIAVPKSRKGNKAVIVSGIALT